MSVDVDQLCAGPCQNHTRRVARAHEHKMARYLAEMAEWRQHGGPEPWKPEVPTLHPVYGEPIYCPDCAYAIKSKLSKLDGAACVYLRESDGMRGQTDQVRVSHSDDPGSPSPTIDDLDELDRWLRDWKAVYLGCDTMSRQGQLSDSITLGTSWLVVRAERILARQDIGHAFGEEVAQWYSRLRIYDPSEVVVERLGGVRCPECGGLTLERKLGDDKVTCRMRDCDRVLKLAEYQDFAAEAKSARSV